ncbi:hypothetical protein GGI59_002655 [Rhizobium lentis]|uniref:Uncharacterized protein n=1 Tax=Rhizobium lentis TaxID=1138194 RepID=A0A7W8UN46_9HYPH|nr:hypothetical protein [Rhizobium lentis]MBB5549979.1 hypothetical protein [Rhizobium lentis]MBB5560993.1 hypothetical protein [Rhizobium lentis]MBB5567578.1 hypothetical protein [Rhizobium lentis]
MNGVGIVSKLKTKGASHPPPPYPCNPAQPVRSGADASARVAFLTGWRRRTSSQL